MIGNSIAQSAVYNFKYSPTQRQKDQDPEGTEEIKPLINEGQLGHLKNSPSMQTDMGTSQDRNYEWLNQAMYFKTTQTIYLSVI